MALEEVTTTTKGSFTTRTMGGLQYRRAECVFAMQSDVDEGIGSRSTRNKREEANMYRRASADGATVEVVLAPVQAVQFDACCIMEQQCRRLPDRHTVQWRELSVLVFVTSCIAKLENGCAGQTPLF